MDKKIIGIIKPFDVYQTFYVYEGDKLKDFETVSMDDIPKMVFMFMDRYDVNEVELSGASKEYLKGIANEIQKEEVNKYNKSVLKINII